jgi:DNA polymerase/3'-5' exonuclease PolX
MELPMTLATAAKKALELEDLLTPHCELIEIVGSVRRRWSGHCRADAAKTVSDLEFVCIPRPDVDPAKLISEIGDGCAVENLFNRWKREDLVTFDPDVKRDGPRYKRFIWDKLCLVDLFIVRPPASFGALVAIRTGPAEFSRLLVTPRAAGGAMPYGLRAHAGGLCRVSLHVGPKDHPCTDACRVRTDTEREFFIALEVEWFHPERRAPEELKEYLSRQRRATHAGTQSQTR